MIKYLVIALSAYLMASTVSAAQRCEAQLVGDKEAIVHIGNRTVTIIGWEHLDGSDTDTLVSGLQATYDSAAAGRCEEAKKNAQFALDTNLINSEKANAVMTRLSQLNSEESLISVAVEMTPEELFQQLETNVRLDEVFATFERVCEPQLRDLIPKLRQMAPGPEFEFHRQNLKVQLVAVENQMLKTANALDFAGEDQDIFDYSNPKITLAAQIAISAIEQHVMEQVQPPDELISLALSFESDLKVKAQLEDQLRFSVKRAMRIIAGANRRNTAIATALLNEKGNVALPIGWRHVNNLVEQILKQCN